MTEDEIGRNAPWPLRAILLLLLGAAAGLAVHLLLGDHSTQGSSTSWRVASAASVACASAVFAVSLERQRWQWSAGFAILAGLTIGLVVWSNGPPDDWGSNEGWQLFAGLLAVAVAVPLFQTARDAGRLRFDYESLHAHIWTNALLAGAALAFVGAVMLLAQLLSELFNLIGIHQLRDLLQKEGAVLTLIGGAAGTAVGLLRDRDFVLRLLRQVATAIVSVLAPVLALGLVLFVLALPFTGLGPLWSETRMTTPILLVCVLGAFLLLNATIGNGPAEEPRSPLLRFGAMALAVVMLPLGLVAAMSVAKRIGQYGFTPDRLWAGVFVLIALCAGLLYLAAVLLRRRDWAAAVRRANITLVIGIGALALLLALPLISFGGISAANQVARLKSGKVAPDRFDWVALRFDFGPAGRRTLQRLAQEADPRLRNQARTTLALRHRWPEVSAAIPRKPAVMNVVPAGVALPAGLRQAIGAIGGCAGEGECRLFWKPGDSNAIVFLDNCPKPDPNSGAAPPCTWRTSVLQSVDGQWRDVLSGAQDRAFVAQISVSPANEALRFRKAMAEGDVAIREVTRRQVFVGGKPEGEPFP